MAALIKEPKDLNPETQDWQDALYKLTRTCGGLLLVGLTNMDNEQAPMVKEGSRFEINGSFYEVKSDEAITGSLTGNTVAYIYAVANGDTATFMYSTNPPDFRPALGGWYSGNNRAVAKFFYTSSQYNGKVILDSYNAMQMTNTEQPIPTTGGVLIPDTEMVNTELSLILQKGVYRYEIKAGKGGNGGNSDVFGGIGSDGQIVTGSFIINSELYIRYIIGGDGNDGDSASDVNEGSNMGSGGGCSGGSTILMLGAQPIFAMGGSGGGGDAAISSGGGGGGGYGLGGKSIDDNSGEGGNNGTGGKGGTQYNNGGDGGNAPGGSGTNGINGGTGGDGKVDAYYPNLISGFQGGGGGTNAGKAMKGGSGLKSTSSGYLRIYRQW
jgi:hypothetical protein